MEVAAVSQIVVSRPFRGRRGPRIAAVVTALSVLAFGVAVSPGAAPAGPAQAVPANQAPTSSLGITSDSTGLDHVFYRGQNAGLYLRTLRDGVWSAESALGGKIVGAPSAAIIGTTLVVAARGRDNALFVRTRTNGVWGAWTSLGGVISASPAITARADGEFDVFVRGTNNTLVTRRLPPGGAWGAWQNLQGTLTSGPAAVFTGGGNLEVYAMGADRALTHRIRTGTTWSAWTPLGGTSYTAPSVTWTPQTSTVSVFLRATNDALSLRQRVGTTWGAFQNLGGQLIDAPAATGVANGGLDVVVRGRDLSIFSRRLRSGVWTAYARGWTPAPKPAPSPSLLGNDWTRVPTSAPVVALTFDAGANANAVPSILNTLKTKNVPATFFLTGEFVRDFPALANDIAVGGGYVIGNHSDTHPDLRTLTDAQVRAQLTTAHQAILFANGVDTRPLFRFPLGGVDSRVLGIVNSLGYVAVRWTVDTVGWQGTSGGRSVQSVFDRVMAGLQPGEIVLMHVGSHPTDGSTLDADALPLIVDAIRARGYRFVTLEALVGPP